MKDSDSVRLLICCSIKKEKFFNLLNVFDILHYFSISLRSLISFSNGGKVGTLYLCNLALLLFVSSLSYIVYQVKRTFNTCPQKLYSLVRIVYSLIDLAVTMYVLFKVVDYGFFADDLTGKLKNLGIFGGFGLISFVNFYWSILLIKTTFEKRDIELEEEEGNGDCSTDLKTQLDVPKNQDTILIDQEQSAIVAKGN